jgi:hypothetical protein
MWELRECDDLEKRMKKLVKKHRQEVINVLDNLQSYLTALRQGLLPQQIVGNWVRSEPRGLRALDQTGPKNPKKVLRLYIYPDEDTQTLYALTIGDKDSQSDDIKMCEVFVENLLNTRNKSTAARVKNEENTKEAL